MNIDDLLRIATERRASDLHLKVGNYPHLRVDGELTPLTEQPRVSAEDTTPLETPATPQLEFISFSSDRTRPVRARRPSTGWPQHKPG